MATTAFSITTTWVKVADQACSIAQALTSDPDGTLVAAGLDNRSPYILLHTGATAPDPDTFDYQTFSEHFVYTGDEPVWLRTQVGTRIVKVTDEVAGGGAGKDLSGSDITNDSAVEGDTVTEALDWLAANGGGGPTIKVWQPAVTGDAPIATLDRLVDMGDGVDGITFDATSVTAPFDSMGIAVSTALPTPLAGKYGVWATYSDANIEVAYYVYSAFVTQDELSFEDGISLMLGDVHYELGEGLSYSDDDENYQYIADWNPVVDSVAVVFDADNRTLSYYTSRDNQAPILSFDLVALGIATVPELVMLGSMGGTASGVSTFDIAGVQSVFGSVAAIDETQLPANAASSFYRLELASPAYLTSLGLTVADGDIVAFSADGQPLRVIQVAPPPAPDMSGYARTADLAPVATTGNYYDLDNRPQALSSFTNDMGFITSAPEYQAGEGLELNGQEFALSQATLDALASIPEDAVEASALLARELIQLPYNVPPNSVLALPGFKAVYVAPGGECRLYNTQANGDVHYSVVDRITGIVANSVVAETSAASVLQGRRIIAASSHIIAVQRTSGDRGVVILDRDTSGVWGTRYTSPTDYRYADVGYAEIIVSSFNSFWLILDSQLWEITKTADARELTNTGQWHRGLSRNRILSAASIEGKLAFIVRDPDNWVAYWNYEEAISFVITTHNYTPQTSAIVIGGGVITDDIVSGEVHVGNSYRLRFGRVGVKEELLLTYESASALRTPTGYRYTYDPVTTQSIRLPRGKTLISDSGGMILARQGEVQLDDVALLPTTLPATPTSPGTRGQIATSALFVYVCVATDSWVRIPKDDTWV